MSAVAISGGAIWWVLSLTLQRCSVCIQRD